MKNIIAIIPARYASTRFEGKPLVDIFGKTMIERVYHKAESCFKYTVVATDDHRIEKNVLSFGGNVVMTSVNHRSGTDRCREALQKAEELFGITFDIVVNLQGDEPFVDISQLESLVKCFDDKACEIATLVKPFGEGEDIFNENSPKVVLSADNFALYFSRSPIPFLRGTDKSMWQSSRTYYKHIGLYGYRSSVLKDITLLEAGDLEKCESLEQLRWLENGYKIKTAITNVKSYAIDTPDDLALVLDMFKDSQDV
ncbi:MAG: 3-deoxy-manno-octulosonate cytidylyltransferase [Rikenellaceae bacterium]